MESLERNPLASSRPNWSPQRARPEDRDGVSVIKTSEETRFSEENKAFKPKSRYTLGIGIYGTA